MSALLYITLSVICAGCALERIYAAVKMVGEVMEAADANGK